MTHQFSEYYQKIPALWARESEKPHAIIPGKFRDMYVEYLSEADWYWTEKIDGTNIRIMWDGHRVHFGGRKGNSQFQGMLLQNLQRDYGSPEFEAVLEEHFGENPVTLYGEGCGPGIQTNGARYGDEPRFIMFDGKYAGQEYGWWKRDAVVGIAGSLGIDVVSEVTAPKSPLWARDVMAEYGCRSTYGEFEAEGWVGRPNVPVLNAKGERIAVKLKPSEL